SASSAAQAGWWNTDASSFAETNSSQRGSSICKWASTGRSILPGVRLMVCALATLVVAALVVVVFFMGGKPGAARAGGQSAGRSPAALLFTGDFEPGNISQWTWGAQCANSGVPSTPTVAS